jgi:hypothetical protein
MASCSLWFQQASLNCGSDDGEDNVVVVELQAAQMLGDRQPIGFARNAAVWRRCWRRPGP